MSSELRVAVIGAGYAGQSHAFGYRNASMAKDLHDVSVILDTVVDANESLAKEVRGQYGFERYSTELNDVLENPNIDAVSLALPNRVYATVMPTIIESKKHIFCEKPLGLNTVQAKEMADRVEKSDLINMVGFSFRRLPALAQLATIVQEGRPGEIETFNAWYYADYAADAQQPLTWRYIMEQSGGGAIADIGAHSIDSIRYVVGEITEVNSALLSTFIDRRPLPAKGGVGHAIAASETGETGAVENDDVAVVNLRAGGAVGTLTLSRIARGIPNDLGIEVHGSKGYARFTSARTDELLVYEEGVSETGMDGPRIVASGPDFPFFAETAAMPGRGVGTAYGEAFIAEIQEFVRAVTRNDQSIVMTPFREAVPTMKVIESVLEAAASGKAVKIA